MRFSQWFGERLDEYLEYGARFGNAPATSYYYTTIVIPLAVIFFALVLVFSNVNSKILWFRNKMSPNKILVEKAGLNPNETLVIKWTCDDYCDTITIYNRNKVLYKNFKNSGNNVFLVYLNDSLIYKQQQHKNMYWKGFTYSFRISKIKNKYLTNLMIKE